MGVGVQKLGSTWHDWLLVLLHNTSTSDSVPGYLQFVWETQLDPSEGKCLSSAVPSNVLSRHQLDSVLHNNPLLVTLCFWLYISYNNDNGLTWCILLNHIIMP